MTIPATLAQMTPALVNRLPYELDDMTAFLRSCYPLCRCVSVSQDYRGWSVIVDGIPDVAMPSRQAGSRGAWETMRLALLVAILLSERPELPIKGAC